MASSRGGRISIDRILATAVVTAALLLVGGSPAWAEDPVSFGADPVVDTVGALGDDADDVRAAIEKTADDTGRQLFVAYVDEFTNPEQADTWANDTAVANNMGAEDYLLAVAIDGRAYYLSAAGNASVTDDQLDRISLREIEPALRDGDWAGAAIAAAEALDDGSGGSGWGWVWFLVLAAVAVAVIAIVLSRRRRRQAPDASGATAPAVPLPELRRRAATALVAADDAIKTSEEELGFAVASYGDAATSAFRQALETAKAGVAEAFRLQQRLDDEVPDTEAQQREVYEGILAATAAADALLDEQAEAFDALRDLERNAPAELERVRAEAAAARATTAPADARLRALSGEYAASALAALADNPAQAGSRLAFADAALERAAAAIAGSRTAEAAVAIRAAEEAVDQAQLLTAAVARLADDLAAADRALADGVADLERDVETARALGGATAAAAEGTAVVAADLRTRIGAAGRDPRADAALLERSNAEIDAAIATARDAAERAARERAVLQRSVDGARIQVQTAEDYVTARRGAVGAEARTRLAEASRLLQRAVAGTDPAAALQSARRSAQLATDALTLAQRDVASFDRTYDGGGGGGDVMGAVLGGILVDSVFGGSRSSRSRGYGGSRSGGFGGSRSSARSGTRRSAGSFGGGGTRGRRGSGGRF
ncbi:hypothetical protein BJ978_002076 [Agromyces terreus]|uniref:TPM domain-containing protein n=1 Tax=Agromyces terreus TaxID=424795 RepID=A0A9X2GYG6_9MICO|nr:TPM domain-containing protein [Agromyces terreus]MCP2371400.1 hypothetical protein [Agromyces terreus]